MQVTFKIVFNVSIMVEHRFLCSWIFQSHLQWDSIDSWLWLSISIDFILSENVSITRNIQIKPPIGTHQFIPDPKSPEAMQLDRLWSTSKCQKTSLWLHQTFLKSKPSRFRMDQYTHETNEDQIQHMSSISLWESQNNKVMNNFFTWADIQDWMQETPGKSAPSSDLQSVHAARSQSWKELYK